MKDDPAWGSAGTRHRSSTSSSRLATNSMPSWFPAPEKMRTVEWVLWGFVIFLLTSPFTFWLMQMDPTIAVVRDLSQMREADNSQWRLYAVRLLVFAIAAGFTIPRWRAAGKAWLTLWPFVPFLLWATASLTWSDSPSTSLHSIVAFVLLVLTVFLMGFRLPYNYIAKATILASALMIFFSVLFCLALPTYGIHQVNDATQAVHAGAWRGVYDHKNHFGQTAAIFATGLIFAGPVLLKSQKIRWTLFAILALLIFLSDSASAIAVIPLAAGLTWLLIILEPAKRLKAIIFLVPAGIIGTGLFNLLLDTLNRDASMTGRTRIWSVAAEWISQRPIYGWGYNTLTYGGFSYELFRKRSLIDPHNAYIEAVLGVGFIGLALYLIPSIVAWTRAQRHRLGSPTEASTSVFFASMTIAWFITSFTEVNGRPFSAAGALGFFVLTSLLSMPLYNPSAASSRSGSSGRSSSSGRERSKRSRSSGSSSSPGI